MVTKELQDYVNKTIADGFSEEEISNALQKSGWQAEDIKQAIANTKQDTSQTAPTQEPNTPGFFSRNKKLLIISAIVIILIPALTYVGFLVYQNYSEKQQQAEERRIAQEQLAELEKMEAEQQAMEAEKQQAQNRDRQRINDIAEIQAKLTEYLTANESYPLSLSALVEAELLEAVPTDPESGQAYLYTPLGSPALHYSLAFVLESKISTLGEGLHVVSSEQSIDADAILNQESTIQGAKTDYQGLLNITNLAENAFSPGNEVAVNVENNENINLQHAVLVMDGLRLTDSTAPFGFKFTAPTESGDFTVEVFGFDGAGKTYYGKTVLKVSE